MLVSSGQRQQHWGGGGLGLAAGGEAMVCCEVATAVVGVAAALATAGAAAAEAALGATAAECSAAAVWAGVGSTAVVEGTGGWGAWFRWRTEGTAEAGVGWGLPGAAEHMRARRHVPTCRGRRLGRAGRPHEGVWDG